MKIIGFLFFILILFPYFCAIFIIYMKTLERLFAEKLLKIKAIKLQPANPFTWASGWKSPFYCDNRKTLSYPSLRNFVKIEITRLILERFGQVDAIAGVATGAIRYEGGSRGRFDFYGWKQFKGCRSYPP